MLLIAVAVLAGFAWYVMSPAERTKTVRTVVMIVRRLIDSARKQPGKVTPFDAALQERTPRVLVTPALLALNLIVFLLMLVGSGSLSNPDTLMAWGGSFGPSTSNGQWWRLVTSMFVHAGFFSLVVNLIGLAQVASLLERMTGHLTLAAVYVATGVIAGLVNLSLDPVTVQVGATGAVLGVYGLLGASLTWGLLNRSLIVPFAALKPLAPAAGIFLLYVVAGGIAWTAAVAALAAGLIGGLVLTRGITEHKPPAQRLAAAVAATMVIAAAAAVPLRGMAFVKPEIGRVVEVEQRTAETYAKAAAQFRTGRIQSGALAQLIERTIVPELHAANVRISGLERVPHTQQPLVADTVEYLRLREESWQFRARALRSSSMVALRDADRREFVALEAFKKITPEEVK